MSVSQKTPWENFQEGNYVAAGFRPEDLEKFTSAFSAITQNGQRISAASIVAAAMTVLFDDSNVASISSHKDAMVCIEALRELCNPAPLAKVS